MEAILSSQPYTPGAATCRAVTALAAAVVLLATPNPSAAQGSAATEREMVEAVIASFPLTGRQVYLSPAIEPSRAMIEAGIQGSPRHTKVTLDRVQKSLGARIADPEDVIACADPARPESCRLPDNGIVFHFLLPDARQDGVLPVRVLVYDTQRGSGGQIVRELWGFHLRQEPGTGWVVLNRQLLNRVLGPF
jgi:hypothetical protein